MTSANWSLPDRLFVLVRLVAFATLLWLGRDQTFLGDEWDWIHYRADWTLTALMSPHNEHWSLGLALVYKPLLELIGLRSYLPYLAVLLILHLLAASALYRFVRSEAGPWTALGCASVFLFLGRAGEDLFWAFQIGFIGATALGLWALVLLLEGRGRTHRGLIAGLLLGAMATSGIGLPFVAAAGLAILLLPDRTRNAWLLVPAVVGYGTWHVGVGAGALPSRMASFSQLADFVRIGLSTAAASLSGTSSRGGLLIVGLMLLAAGAEIGRSLRSPAKMPRLGLICGLFGAVTQFVLIGSVRAQFGAAQATSSRYVYSTSAFLLVALVAWIAAAGRSRGRSASVAGAILLLVAFRAGLFELEVFHHHLLNQAQETRAAVNLILAYGGSPGFPADLGANIGGPRYITAAKEGRRAVIPGATELRAITRRMGSPERDMFFPGLGDIPLTVRDRILFRMVADPIPVTAAAAPPSDAHAPARWSGMIDAIQEIPSPDSSGCLLLRPAGGDALAAYNATPGASLFVRSTAPGPMKVLLSRWGTFSDEASVDLSLVRDEFRRVDLPLFDPGAPWIVALRLPPGATTTVCLSSRAAE